jgi:acyl transferase domain-containing protein
MGGTNAHAIIEEFVESRPSDQSRPYQLLVLSARTENALQQATNNLAEFLRSNPGVKLADVAFTLQTGRRKFSHRRVVVCQGLDDTVTALQTLDASRVLTKVNTSSEERPVAFMFPGQGAQYANMGRQLYDREPVFRQHVDRCCELLRPHLGLDLRTLLFPSEEAAEAATNELTRTAITQPALVVVEYALAQLWISWGVRPQAMIGHSIGEYVAACLAGVISLEDALALVAARGRMMQQLPRGSMMAVPMTESELRPLLGDDLAIAAVNVSSICVVSGETERVDDLERRLADDGIACQRLHTSHAFHSKMMDSILDAFAELVRSIKLNAPAIPYISNVSGTWVTAAEAMDPNYWARPCGLPTVLGSC